jgi:Flp pilus assembly protein TadG
VGKRSVGSAVNRITRWRSSRRHEGGRRRRERGATLVEAAIVAPLFFMLIFGVVEAGWDFFKRDSTTNMSVVGARAGAGSANDSLADYNVLQAVKGASAGISPSAIKVIVVYRATSASDTVPSACKTASVTNTSTTRGCNRYTGSDLSLTSDQFGCTGPPGPTVKKDSYWCPTTRKAALSGTNGPPDYVGVYVDASGASLTGVFGPILTLKSDTVMRIEPRSET